MGVSPYVYSPFQSLATRHARHGVCRLRVYYQPTTHLVTQLVTLCCDERVPYTSETSLGGVSCLRKVHSPE